ncbi:efflux RND transporter periplasmic adaptor subunit [Mangrovicella endophytica]|uniref:efflux RND transporter periplasmic adaptor subunit n=1 Tax=Mangrovicella endophytica TaxID=2066697 RepID=UPI000C9E01FE|nr:efflux RND transporter periplasmic adaptor subunit [Mangrovicella endophytica]
MAILKQIVVTIVVALLAGTAWLHFDPRPGAYLLAPERGLPASLRSVVAAISPAGEEPPVSGTETAENSRGGGNGRSGGGGRRGSREPLVVSDPVRTATTRDRLKAIGTGEAVQSVSVYSDSTGIVTEVGFKSSDAIEAGQALITLQNDTETLALDRARIATAAATDKLERYKRLQSARTITSVELGDVQRELEVAQLDMRSAEVALSKRRIFAPISGRVGIVNVDVGDLIGSQTAIATIDDRSKVKVIFYTPESFVPQLKLGAEVTAATSARAGKVYRGVISAIDSRLDEASRTLRTEATLDNAADELRPGMSFSLTLAFPGETFPSVDPLAIQWQREGPYVWKIVDGKAAKTPVQIVERNIDRVLVTADALAEGDAVATEGVQSLRDGVTVRIADQPGDEKAGSKPQRETPRQPDAAPQQPQQAPAGVSDPSSTPQARSGSGERSSSLQAPVSLAEARGVDADRSASTGDTGR